VDSSGDYFVPQNGGVTPTNSDKSRFATITLLDYQKDSQDTVAGDTGVAALLFPGIDPTTAGGYINTLINFVSAQMSATDGSGGIPAGFVMNLGPINGDGTGSGAFSGLPDANHLGNVVKVQHPAALQLVPNGPGAYSAAVLVDGPVGYWMLAEASGTAAADSSGNGQTGAYVGGVTLGQTGPIAASPATSALLNGSTGAVTLGLSAAALALPTPSVECWVKLAASQTGTIFVANYGVSGSVTQGWALGVSDTSANVVKWFTASSDGSTDTLEGGSLTPGQWYHIVAIYDGTTKLLYVNGVLVASSAWSHPIGYASTLASLGFLDYSSGSQFLNGTIGQAAVYPGVLPAGRVLSHYNAGITSDPWYSNEQQRNELLATNLLGQNTIHVSAEGIVTATVRYPQNDPEGAAQYLVPSLSNKQYGFVKEVHVDADPATVMTLLGPDADLAAFTGIIPRLSSAGVYLDLVTSYKPSPGGSAQGCPSCAYDRLGNPLAVTDARNNTTTFERNELGEPYRTTSPAPYNYAVETSYDANRNVIQVDTQDVIVKYTTNDPGDPAYAKFIPTGQGSTANLPTRPGPGGSVRPGWFSDLFGFDLLDNKIEEDIDATGSSPASLVTTFAYDFNQNLVKIIKPLTNTIEQDYDERNLKIAIRVGGPNGSVTVMAYDGNMNLTDVIGPATRGTPAQTLSAVIGDAFGGSSSVTFSGDWLVENFYDGFDRNISRTDAAGGMALNFLDPGGRTISTATYGSPGGPTPADRSGSSNVLLASSEARFDEAGRQYETQRDVFLDGGAYYLGVPGNLPSGRTVTHTGGGLATNSTANNHTATVTLTAGGTSYVLGRTVFDRADRVTAAAADNGAITTITLDGAGRQPLVVDALGNSVARSFDNNGNTVLTTRIGKCTISGSIAAESFSTAFAIDVLNRAIITMQQGPDGSLNTNWVACCTWPVLPTTLFTFTGFDSRGDRTNRVDPKQNTTIWEFDGASRRLREKRHLRPSGDGSTAVSATVLTQAAYDANSNTIRLVDSNGGTTGWLYDLLDRNTVMTFHDGSTRTTVFNPANEVIGYTDGNGSVFTNTPDVLGRITAVAIAPAAGVAGNAALPAIPGTLAQGFEFDGLSRPTFCRDSVGTVGVSGLVNADVGFTRDSIDRVLEEQQTYLNDTRYVTHNAWMSYPSTGLTFPSARQITVGFDALYRTNAINETSGGASIAAWQFFGGRIATVTLGNGIVTSFMNDAQTRSAIQLGQTTPAWGSISTDQLGYDGSGRPIGKRHSLSGSVVVGFTTAYDPSSNKLFERALHAESRSSLYATDSMDRLLQYQRGVLATGGGSIATPISLPNTDIVRNYALDGLGNWQNTSFTPVASPPGLDVRTHNKLNQITAFNAPSATTRILYDQGNNAGSPPQKGNGNIISDGTRANAFDALNRLRTVNLVNDGAAVAAYAYDAIGRRIVRQVFVAVSGTVPASNSRYLVDGQQIVEELTAATGSTAIQYIWGQYIDELIQLKALTTIGPQPLAAGNYYLLSDLLYRSAALTSNTAGVIVEAFDTDAYGNTLLFSAGGGTGGTWFSNADTQAAYSACRYVFTGREYDPEARNHCYRARYYQAELGRFLSFDGVISINPYLYCAGAPASRLDPSGYIHCGTDSQCCSPPGSGSPNEYKRKVVAVETTVIGSNPYKDEAPGEWAEAAKQIEELKELGDIATAATQGSYHGGRIEAGTETAREIAKQAVEDYVKKHVGENQSTIDKAVSSFFDANKGKQGYYLWVGYQWDECVPCWNFFDPNGFRWVTHDDRESLRWVQCRGPGNELDATAWGGGVPARSILPNVPTAIDIALCVRQAEAQGGGQTREELANEGQ
jgi:RHS repeat-associated protein